MARPLLSFGPTAATLVVQTSPAALAVYDIATGKARREWGDDASKTRISPIALSPSRRRIALAFEGREPVGVTDLETDAGLEMEPSPIDPSENIRYGKDRLTPGPTARRIYGMLFTPDESTLYLGRSASVGVVDVGSGRQRRSLDMPRGTRMGSLRPLSVSADGSRLLTHMDDFLYPIFSLSDGQLVSEGSPQSIESEWTEPIFVEGRLPGSDGYGHAVGHLGHPVTVGLLSRESEPIRSGERRSYHTDTWGRCVSPDGSVLALSLSALANVSLWDAGTGRWIDLLSSYGSFEPEGRIVFSPDGKVLAASSRHGLDVFDVAARKRLYRIGGEDHG
jgi:WD40 repeat protein